MRCGRSWRTTRPTRMRPPTRSGCCTWSSGRGSSAACTTVVDATNLTDGARRPLLALAAAAGRPVVAVVFDLPLDSLPGAERVTRRIGWCQTRWCGMHHAQLPAAIAGLRRAGVPILSRPERRASAVVADRRTRHRCAPGAGRPGRRGAGPVGHARVVASGVAARRCVASMDRAVARRGRAGPGPAGPAYRADASSSSVESDGRMASGCKPSIELWGRRRPARRLGMGQARYVDQLRAGLLDPVAADAVVGEVALLGHRHQAGGPEQREVVLGGRLGQVELRGQLREIPVAIRQVAAGCASAWRRPARGRAGPWPPAARCRSAASRTASSMG